MKVSGNLVKIGQLVRKIRNVEKYICLILYGINLFEKYDQ